MEHLTADNSQGLPDSRGEGPRTADLEAMRHHLVHTVLQIRDRFEKANTSLPEADSANLEEKLLRAAVRDLEQLDERLYAARMHQERSTETITNP